MEVVVKQMYWEYPASESGYVFPYANGQQNRIMEHLACFSGGMFAMGARDMKDLSIGAFIANSCYRMYEFTRTGLSPESVFVKQDANYDISSPYYILRPEAVESFFYMWRLTHDQKYRNWGWSVFQAIEKTLQGCGRIYWNKRCIAGNKRGESR